LPEHLAKVARDGGRFHQLQHGFRRSFDKNLQIASDGCFGNHTHSLKLKLKLIFSVDYSPMPMWARKGENGFFVEWRFIEFKSAKVEQLYFHGIANKLIIAFYGDD